MDSLIEVWRAVLALCKEEISDVMYNMWLAPLEIVKFENDTVVFSVTSDFKKSIIIDKFAPLIKKGFEQVMGFPVEIDIIATNIPFTGDDEPEADKKNEDKEKEKSDSPANSISDLFTFDNFVVGTSNSLAYNVSVGVAQNPGTVSNPFLIYGRSGLGKTHLMFAIYNIIKQRNPDYLVIYTTGENFMNEMVESLTRKNMSAFRNKYRNVDVLLMDDIQFIQRGEAVQEEFFHTFNALYNANKQIILTSDVSPRNMEILEERLRTRFEMGITADIKPPDVDTRKAIILRKSKEIGLTLSDTTVEYIAQKIKNNIRQLEGIVKKIHAMTNAFGAPISNEQLNSIIRDVTTESQPVAITVEKVLDYLAKAFGITVADIKSEKRQSKINTARQVAMYVLKEVTDLTLQDIGDYFNKTHPTVIHSISAITEKMDETPSVKAIAMGAIHEFGGN